VTVTTTQFFLKWWRSPPLTCPGGDRHHNAIFGGWWWLSISIFPLVVSPHTMHHHAPPATSPHTMRGEYPPIVLSVRFDKGGAVGLINFHDTVFFLGHHPPRMQGDGVSRCEFQWLESPNAWASSLTQGEVQSPRESRWGWDFGSVPMRHEGLSRSGSPESRRHAGWAEDSCPGTSPESWHKSRAKRKAVPMRVPKAVRVPTWTGLLSTNVSVLSDISLLSDGLGQCRQVSPNLSQRSDTIWRLLFQNRNIAPHAAQLP
jgi:hypothetical protein